MSPNECLRYWRRIFASEETSVPIRLAPHPSAAGLSRHERATLCGDREIPLRLVPCFPSVVVRKFASSSPRIIRANFGNRDIGANCIGSAVRRGILARRRWSMPTSGREFLPLGATPALDSVGDVVPSNAAFVIASAFQRLGRFPRRVHRGATVPGCPKAGVNFVGFLARDPHDQHPLVQPSQIRRGRRLTFELYQ